MPTQGNNHQRTAAQQGAQDAGRYFRYMADYVGFTTADADAIRSTKPIVEKHLPTIVGKFYTHLLRYPPTRRFFLKKDGAIDQEYLELRMRHLSNFWLRAADGIYDDEFARYVDYVGRAHTAHGADPSIYIAERYVIGQVGMMQHAISEALSSELRAGDDETEFRALEAWDKLMMVILELLARAYGREHEAETYAALVDVDSDWVGALAAKAIAREQQTHEPQPMSDVAVAAASEIPPGERKIIQVGDLSIGVFHHIDGWYAVRNSCVHRGGPVATGTLEGDVLTCPWHGFQFNLRTGKCLADPAAELDQYAVKIVDDQVIVVIPVSDSAEAESPPTAPAELRENEFRIADLASGRSIAVTVHGAEVAVYNLGGTLYATQNDCPHAGALLTASELDGKIVTCFAHGSCFDVTTGAVLCGPAETPLKTYRVTVTDGIARVDEQM